MNNTSSLLDQALSLAERGWRSFPVVNGTKTPKIKRFPTSASLDPEAIKRWLVCPVMGQPLDVELGIAPTESQVILDVDCKDEKPGFETLARLEAELGPLPQTFAVQTRSGGKHLYFRLPDGVFVKNDTKGKRLGAGIDVKTLGGLVVGPGSFDGAYQVVDHAPAAELPEAWVERMERVAAAEVGAANAGRPKEIAIAPGVTVDAPENIEAAIAFLKEREPAVEGAGGDNWTFKTACSLKDLGVGPEACFELMNEHFNWRCSPPWDLEGAGSLRTKVDSAYAPGRSPIGCKTAAAFFEPIDQGLQEMFGLRNSVKPKVKLRRASSVQPRSMNWLWHPYVAAGMISILGAKGGSCKGLVCSALTAAITTGGQWPDGSGPAPKGSVIWAEAEDPLEEAITPRLIAAGADRDHVLYASQDEFAGIGNLRALIHEEGIRLIVLSPMTTFLDVKDMNSEKDVRAILKHMQAAIEGSDCAIIGIAHANKKQDLAAVERLLGSVAYTNFVRSVMLTAPEDISHNLYRLVHPKHNLSIKGPDLLLRPVHVGKNARDQFLKLEWSLPESNVNPEAVFDRKKEPKPEKLTASLWLVRHLRDGGESKRSDVVAAGALEGFSQSALDAAASRNVSIQSGLTATVPPIATWRLG